MSNNQLNHDTQSLTILRQKHGAHILDLVQDNLKAEDARQNRLRTLKNPQARKRLEKTFDSERYKERTRIERLQAEQRVIMQSKLQQFTKQGRGSTNDSAPGFGSTATRMESKATALSTKKRSKKLRQHGANVVGSSVVMSSSTKPTSRQSSRRSLAETVSDTQFYRNMYAKTEYKSHLAPLTEDSLFKHCTRSERSLLHKRNQLISQLHDITQQQHQLLETASTVRSSVSEFGSPRSYKTASSYAYVPFRR